MKKKTKDCRLSFEEPVLDGIDAFRCCRSMTRKAALEFMVKDNLARRGLYKPTEYDEPVGGWNMVGKIN